MLEPIIEETSEEEENPELWGQYDSVWSSESDTGSVIRVDLAQGDDNDCNKLKMTITCLIDKSLTQDLLRSDILMIKKNGERKNDRQEIKMMSLSQLVLRFAKEIRQDKFIFSIFMMLIHLEMFYFIII